MNGCFDFIESLPSAPTDPVMLADGDVAQLTSFLDHFVCQDVLTEILPEGEAIEQIDRPLQHREAILHLKVGFPLTLIDPETPHARIVV
jgi:hypothetical protein